MNAEQVLTHVMDLARDKGAVYPALAESGGEPLIVDTDSGRTWAIQLREIR